MDSLETFTREEKQNIILNLSILHESSFWLSRELKESQCLSFDNHKNHVTLVISCLEHSFLLFHLSGLDFQVNRSNMSQLVFSSLSALSFTTLSILCEQTEPEIMRLVSFMFFLQTSKDVSDVNGFDCDCKHGILHFPFSTALSVILYFIMNSLQFKRENICQRKLFFLYLCRYILFRPDVSRCPNQRLLQLSQRTQNTCFSKKNYINKLGNINSLQSFAEF